MKHKTYTTCRGCGKVLPAEGGCRMVYFDGWECPQCMDEDE